MKIDFPDFQTFFNFFTISYDEKHLASSSVFLSLICVERSFRPSIASDYTETSKSADHVIEKSNARIAIHLIKPFIFQFIRIVKVGFDFLFDEEKTVVCSLSRNGVQN